jgi:carboxylesterase type B
VLPGNLGLWDIILALKWVQTDIHVFGGDPDRVTLMGHGSGAAAASILSISPAASGAYAPSTHKHTFMCADLFAQTILMSGTALSPGAVRRSAVNATWQLEAALGCRAANSSTLYECLKNVLPQDIVGRAVSARAPTWHVCIHSVTSTTTTKTLCRSSTQTVICFPSRPNRSLHTDARSRHCSVRPPTRVH